MAARVTAQTALPAIRQLGSDLGRWVQEGGPLSAAPQLAHQIVQLNAALLEPRLLIEVWVDDSTSPAEAAAWLLGDVTPVPGDANSYSASFGARPVHLSMASSAAPLVGMVGRLLPPVLVWMCDRDPEALTGRGLEDRPLVVSTHVLRGAPREVVQIDRRDAPGVLARLLGSAAMTSTCDLLLAEAGARALESCATIASLAFEQELRGLRARRALVQQRVSAQPKSSPSSASEWLGALKGRLQRLFAELARGIDDRFQQQLGSPAAPLWTDLDAHLDTIDALAYEPRLKTVVTKMPAESEEAWLEFLRTRIQGHCIGDLTALRDTLRQASAEIDKELAASGGPPLVIPFQQLGDDRLMRLLDGQLRAQRRYQGEQPQRGFFEYLMMARRYQTVAFMLISAFGLSFVRTYREFMLPAAVLLLSLGSLQMMHSVRRERAETLAKELDKLREQLRGESKRMVAEVQRAWPGVITQHLSDQLTVAFSQIESSVREHASRAASDGAEEKQRLQRQLQAFDGAERKLSMPAKGRDAVAQGIAQVRGELRQLLAAGLKGAAV